MASRRDQLQSYQFLVQRVVSALVLREADPAQTPFRRLAGASMVSVMIGVIALAGVGVFGIIRPSGKQSWKAGGKVIVEKETGASYYFRKDQSNDADLGVLHPTVNFTSAALLAGSSESVLVSRNTLVDVPRGRLLGIPGAPVALPPAKRLLPAPWVLCSVKEPDTSDQLESRTVLLVTGSRPPGGRPVGDDALLVRDSSTTSIDGVKPALSAIWLVYRGRKHPVRDEAAVKNALRRQNTVDADGAWLEALPQGLPLAPLAVPARGTPSAAIPGVRDAKVGQVFRAESGTGGEAYYVAVGAALRPVTQLQALILLASAATKLAYRGVAQPDFRVLAAADVASATISGELPTGELQPPADPPTLATPTDVGSLCVPFDGSGDSSPTVLYDVLVQAPKVAIDTATRTQAGNQLADRIVVREGWAALVESMPTPTATRGTITLVTDSGTRYPVSSPQTAAALGYTRPPIRLPAGLVTRVPEGPGLSPEAALGQSG